MRVCFSIIYGETCTLRINYWSQYASYSTMFCLLHSNISKEQHKKYLQSIQPLQKIIVIVIVIVIFRQGFHSMKNTDFQWSPVKQAYIHTYIRTYIHTYMENILVKRAPHISIRESHNASISAMSNSFHNMVSKA